MDHLHGPKGFCRRVVLGILERFLTVEQRFSRGDATDQEIVDSLRLEHSDRLQTVLDMVVSHQGLAAKCELLLGLMTAAVLQQPDAYRPLLRRIAALRGVLWCFFWVYLGVFEVCCRGLGIGRCGTNNNA